MGAELIPFSPLTDPALPETLHGLYLGGGYPELYARQLSENRGMRRSIKEALKSNLPCLAECGGFLYLTEQLDGLPMVGFLPGSSGTTGRLQRFGYIRLQARQDNLLCRAGESIPAHSFHYYDTEKPGDGFRAEKHSGRSWDCVVTGETLYAGFPHIHFYAQPEFAENFYDHCLKEKHRYDRNQETHGD